jgi:hypothetical protein
MSTPMASCLHNGNNETKIGLSQSIGISFSENNGNEIEIKNTQKLIDIWIPRDLNLPKVNANYVNITKLMNKNTTNDTSTQLYPIGLNKTTFNSSIHLILSPLNNSIGYLILLKLNTTPRVNSTFQDYDHWKIFCPSGNILI